ncbi:hypothetical protein E3N88_27093 [Mikania micrantha]|uniref:AT-hook motif nuclear-localized protein n=1 Tax=Mikania micrantha TaxID=192012 RepID=A0A5N6MYN4_9ASTR|nr:hypothetical protein E3N88_27093 [Mikania micrantha]
MESREPLAPPSSLQRHQHHHQQLTPERMMPPNFYATHHHHLPNNPTTTPANNNSIVESMQQLFGFHGSDQYGDGSSPPGGFSAGGFNIEPVRKKRGRPRKYSPSQDGNIALGLAPAPVTVGYSGGGSGGGHFGSSNGGGGTTNPDSSAKKHRGRPPGSGKKQLDALGSPGVGFTPHVITVKAGEDIASKMTAFSQQGPRAICILSANGAISNVTLRQPAMSEGTVTYEGRFEIVSLSGSFMLADSNNGNQSSWSCGLSVSLAGSDGRVLGDAKKPKTTSGPIASPHGNMLNFGGGGDDGGPRSDGPSNESFEDSGSSPLRRPYDNASQQPQPLPQMQQMYSNMGWPNSTINMLRN